MGKLMAKQAKKKIQRRIKIMHPGPGDPARFKDFPAYGTATGITNPLIGLLIDNQTGKIIKGEMIVPPPRWIITFTGAKYDTTYTLFVAEIALLPIVAFPRIVSVLPPPTGQNHRGKSGRPKILANLKTEDPSDNESICASNPVAYGYSQLPVSGQFSLNGGTLWPDPATHQVSGPPTTNSFVIQFPAPGKQGTGTLTVKDSQGSTSVSNNVTIKNC